MSDCFCIAPFVNLSTTTDGHARLCCQAQRYDNLKITENSLSDIWHSKEYQHARQQFVDNQWPAECAVCKNNEARGISSRRQLENNRWKHLDWSDVINDPKIYCYDLRMGHTCNLACIMCTPMNSSLWATEHTNYEHLKTHVTHSGHKWASDSDLLDDVKNNLSNVQMLYFAGGEPLLIKKHKELITYCIENNYAKNITLIYDTNGTQITPEWIELWHNFKKVKIQFSIDGGREVVEYVRYPVKYDTLTDALTLLKESSCDVYLQMALGAYNIFEVDNIQKLAQEYQCAGINISIVDWPDFMSMDNLTDDIKKDIIQKYSDCSIGRVKTLVKNIRLNNNTPTQLINYFKRLDSVRGLDYKRVFEWL